MHANWKTRPNGRGIRLDMRATARRASTRVPKPRDNAAILDDGGWSAGTTPRSQVVGQTVARSRRERAPARQKVDANRKDEPLGGGLGDLVARSLAKGGRDCQWLSWP